MNEREGKSGRMWWTNPECRAFTRRVVELIRVHLYRGKYEPPSRAIWHWSGDWQRREVEEKKGARNCCLESEDLPCKRGQFICWHQSWEPVRLGMASSPFHFILNPNAGISWYFDCTSWKIIASGSSTVNLLIGTSTYTMMQLGIYWHFLVSYHIIIEIKSPIKPSVGIV